jgi:hypothetical protein
MSAFIKGGGLKRLLEAVRWPGRGRQIDRQTDRHTSTDRQRQTDRQTDTGRQNGLTDMHLPPKSKQVPPCTIGGAVSANLA